MSIKRLNALKQRKAAAVDQMKAVRAAAGDALFTDEQDAQFKAAKAEAEQLSAAIEQEEQALDIERSASALVLPDDARIETGADRRAADPKWGFKNFGEFAAVSKRAQLSGQVDERLTIGAATLSTYGNEGSTADGGFLIPPEFSAIVWKHALEEDAFLPLTDGMPVQGNSMAYPADETTPWGTDGVRAYWEAEAAAATQTKPKGQVNTLRLNKLMALVPVTDELQADASALGTYVGGLGARAIRWKTNLSLFEGSGAGECEGAFTAAARVDVAKETGQAAATLVADNVAKMYARQLHPARAVWLIQPQVMPQVMTMTIGNQPIWTPPNAGFKDAPMGMLLGRPIYSTEMCKALGTVGDIGFIDWKSVRSITKAGGIETATSMHLWFDQGMNAYRFTFRVDAKPAAKAAVASKNGGAGGSRSPFVFLATRS